MKRPGKVGNPLALEFPETIVLSVPTGLEPFAEMPLPLDAADELDAMVAP